ncbi:hypothetical protein LIPSTDRAFT_102129 [Lipomyces starkeyi NRRL Y-11557]|uniref:Uncharacterized protein n=1 Tax=Lipomyces starkeyi NRRL Y-11557 TaxID=675824 RepID=A0A1E3QEA9_LIPST|nr:hypothetical protein LIPSTDRAFT_102129 [Lipomyces starkeyi NRRL Y-11557]
MPARSKGSLASSQNIWKKFLKAGPMREYDLVEGHGKYWNDYARIQQLNAMHHTTRKPLNMIPNTMCQRHPESYLSLLSQASSQVCRLNGNSK